MDGTLIDSVAGVTGSWELFAKKYPDKNINVKEILSCGSFSRYVSLLAHISLWFIASHGIRTAENLRKYCGIEDPNELQVRMVVHLVLYAAQATYNVA